MTLKSQENKSIKQACGNMQELQPKVTVCATGVQHIYTNIASNTPSYRRGIKQRATCTVLFPI